VAMPHAASAAARSFSLKNGNFRGTG
jgi:hypothetical protein